MGHCSLVATSLEFVLFSPKAKGPTVLLPLQGWGFFDLSVFTVFATAHRKKVSPQTVLRRMQASYDGVFISKLRLPFGNID